MDVHCVTSTKVLKLISQHKKRGLKISTVCKTEQNTGNLIESSIKLFPSI